MGIFVSPSEPETLRNLGKSSLLGETFGVDILLTGKWGKAGIQRKEWKDLFQSVADGRIGVQVAQMQALPPRRRLLVVEGKIPWSSDGVLLAEFGRPWTRAGFEKLLWSIQAEGITVTTTANLTGTVAMVEWWADWVAKDHDSGHRTLRNRPGAPTTIWGTRPDDLEWAAWVMQGFPGIGPELAKRIVTKFGGLPFRWRVEKKELEAVKGLGGKKIDKMMNLLMDQE